MKTISFYKTASGQCPIEKHLDTLNDMQITKIAWVLKLIRETDHVPVKYFKKLIVLTNLFQKKAQKTSRKEIKLAEGRKKEYLNRG